MIEALFLTVSQSCLRMSIIAAFILKKASYA